MADDSQTDAGTGRGGDRRGGDRRRTDRRNTDRRTPPPPWRRPWALVAYGVLGALAIVLLVNAFRGEPERTEPAVPGEVVSATGPLAVQPPDSAAAAGPPQEANSAADYERLIAEGQAAAGRRVRVELLCSTISSVALRNVERIEGAVAELADAERRVPAADCRWGQGDELRREDFLLLVPPALAEQFASAPVVQDGFVSRRRIPAEVEWVGRSEALALRTVGVLREIRAR